MIINSLEMHRGLVKVRLLLRLVMIFLFLYLNSLLFCYLIKLFKVL
jgi:hypothetical protein